MVRSSSASTRDVLREGFDRLIGEFSKLNTTLEKILERLPPADDKKEQSKKVEKKTHR